MKVVTARIPEDNYRALKEIEGIEKIERAEAIRRLLALGIYIWKKERAIDQLRKRRVSLRKAAGIAGITYVEMLDLAAQEGIVSGYSISDLEDDLVRG